MDLGLDTLIGDGGLLNKAGQLGDALNSAVGKARGWDSLVSGAARPSSPAAPRSASAGDAAAVPAPQGFLAGVSGIAVAGLVALGALVAWAVWGR